MQPRDVLGAGVHRGPEQKRIAPELGVLPAQLRDQAHEARAGRRSRLAQPPVDPGDVVVLAIGVVVAALRPRELVARLQHRHSLGEEQRGEEIAHLAPPRRIDLGVLGRTLDAAVPAQVVSMAVVVVLEIRLVVAIVVAHQIAQREAVVRGHEIDAGGGLAAVVAEHVAGSGKALGEFADFARIAAPERTHRIAIAVIPLGPAGRKAAQLVAAETDIPGLGDHLHMRERGHDAHRAGRTASVR